MVHVFYTLVAMIHEIKRKKIGWKNKCHGRKKISEKLSVSWFYFEGFVYANTYVLCSFSVSVSNLRLIEWIWKKWLINWRIWEFLFVCVNVDFWFNYVFSCFNNMGIWSVLFFLKIILIILWEIMWWKLFISI